MPKNFQSQFWHPEEYHRNSSIQEKAASELIHHLKIIGFENILDVGCGDGKLTARLSKLVPYGSVLGIDISSEMINFASQHFAKEGYLNLNFLVKDAQLMDYQNQFDIVFSSFALQWLSDPSIFFKSVYVSLKTKGCIAATIPLGISSALENSINAIISQPQWASFFQLFSPNWRFLKEADYVELLSSSLLLPRLLKVTLHEEIFDSKDLFEKYVMQWLSYLRPLPVYLRSIFFKQIIDKYLEEEPLIEKKFVRFRFSRIDIIAEKSNL